MFDILDEHRLARPLEVPDYKLFVSALRVPPRALTHSWAEWYATVERERVVFEGERFDFSRYRPESAAVNAYTLPLYDEAGDPADILAFRPNGPAAPWLGRAAMAGAEQVLFPRDSEPLDAHADVLGWLRSGRRGIVILDHVRAAERLQDVTLRARDLEHGRQLRAALARPAPRIVVADFLDNVQEVAA